MRNKFARLSGIVLASLSLPLMAGAVPPATQPTPRVEIFAFTPIAKPTDGDWVGRGIQENLQSDVSHTGATLVLPPQAMPGSDDAINSAKQNHADLAVIGTYQVLGDQIRVNGNIVDVATNASLGGFSATGLRSDLFKVEDALGEQLRGLLPRPMTPDQFSETALQSPPAPTVAYQAPVQNYYSSSPPVTTYGDGTPVQVYVAPDYSDSYPFGYYGGFGFVGGYYNNYYGNRGRGYDNHGYYGRPNPSFHNPVYHNSAPSFGGHFGSGGFSGGGFHGGGGGGRR